MLYIIVKVMLKRFTFIIIVILMLSFISGCVNKNNAISQKEAQRIAETIVVDDEKVGIKNYDSPLIEKIQEKNSHNLFLANKYKKGTSTDIKGKTIWKVTYRTKMNQIIIPNHRLY